jgi:L-ribulose-5-phosphate 3-epimerase
MKANKLGVATATYHSFTTEQTLDGVSKGGYKYVELLSVPGFGEHLKPRAEEMKEDDAERLIGLCRKYGLELFCIGVYMRLMKEGSVELFKRVIDAADMLGARYINTDTGEVKNRDGEKRFYKDLKELGEYAQSKDVTICFELHGDWCNTGKKTAEVVKKIDNSHVRINYDTGNAIFYGNVRPEEDIEYAIPYMAFLHVKDSGGVYQEYNFPVLGEGTVDFDKIFKLIEDYAGPLSLELELDGKEHAIEEVNAGVKKCHEFLKGYGYQ